jgi:hypothetical protein
VDVPLDDDAAIEQHIRESVEKVGWAVLGIPEEEGPAFAYSIGMFRTLGHPEVIMIGQKIPLMHWVINHVGERVREGGPFRHGDVAPGFLEGYDVCFVAVDRAHYRDYFGYARWFYQGDDFPVLQCVWPDKGGRFPWHPDAPDGWHERQPILGAPPSDD